MEILHTSIMNRREKVLVKTAQTLYAAADDVL
jgi:hypothetical protein